ncbi:MAG: SdrD B-like domain-containing protein [Deltaproteobacteria bacterium]
MKSILIPSVKYLTAKRFIFLLILFLTFCGQNKIISQSTINGSVWHDLNADGQQISEPFMPGYTVQLYNSANVILDEQVTSASGTFSFSSLLAGTYYIKFLINTPDIISPSGYGSPTNNCDVTGANGVGTTDNIVLSGTDNFNNIDAGFYNYVKIGDYVWEDRNGNGLQDINEPGIESVAVNLIKTAGNSIVASAITDADGLYYFDDSQKVVPGEFFLAFIVPSGYVIIDKNTGADSIDSDADPVSGLTDLFIMESGGESNNLDVGMFRPPVIGDKCWRDQNKNGIQDAREVVSPNIEVWLLRASDDVEIEYTVTDLFGHYQFGPDPNIKPGEYYIRFGKPAKFFLTIPNAGNELLDSDPDTLNGETQVIMVESGESDFSIDAGYYILPPDDCDGVSAQECGDAEVICKLQELNEFCKSMDPVWQQTPIPGCGGGYAFHNPSWFAFVAGSSDIYLIIHAAPCVAGGDPNNIGIQWGIYDDCNLQGPVILQCPCVTPGDIDVNLSGLNVGQTYYFFIDGCNGTQCTYWVEIVSGGGIPDVLGPGNVVCESQNCENICNGTEVSFILEDIYNARYYSWYINGDTIITEVPHLTFQFDSIGTYNVCVFGYNECSQGDMFCLPVIINSGIILNISSTPETGNNTNDGTATANHEGGVPPYTYVWNTGQTTQTITGLAPGTYSVTVTDTNLCNSAGSVFVNSNGCVALSLDIFKINESCSGYCDGAIAVTGVNNGAAPYVYSWSNGSNTPMINNLCSGIYILTITDVDSCTVVDSVFIESEVEIMLTIDTIVNITSNGYGAILISVNEGNYSYSWTGPENFASNNLQLVNLKVAGCYTLIVTDIASGCKSDSTICIADLTETSDLFTNDKVMIYPNPANDYLIVDFSALDSGEANIYLSDLSGRKIISARKSATENKLQLNTGHINAGLYIIRIDMKDNAFYRKVGIVR